MKGRHSAPLHCEVNRGRRPTPAPGGRTRLRPLGVKSDGRSGDLVPIGMTSIAVRFIRGWNIALSRSGREDTPGRGRYQAIGLEFSVLAV